jgi:SAM-dependent methyltransferase
MEILSIATQKGINVYAVKGNWQLDRSIQSKIIAMAFSMATEIERDLISQRTKEALKGGRFVKTIIIDADEQEYGTNPIAVRETDQYQKEYIKKFVEKWDDLIDWDKRAKGEGNFVIDLLKARGVKRVLDVATGTGFHSVRLLKAGFEVISSDGNVNMLAKAFENARRHGFVLRTVQADWRFLTRDVHGHYDALICLGNSFTHLFTKRDRRKALAEFYAALHHDGLLILDQRNYDAIIDNGFSSKHIYYYCGDNVTAEPDYVDEGLVRFKYTFADNNEFFLNMYPLRKNYVRQLLHEVGFQTIETYGDFQEIRDEETPDFLIHVADKRYVSLSRAKPEKGVT